jgi:hypothetical protein
MKKLLTGILLLAITSCNSNAGNTGENNTENGGLTNPTAIDTTKHPSGMENSSVISTDTAAMNVQNSINKAKEAEKKE